MARFYTANEIINRAALECGLVPASDPSTSTDESFQQLKGLLDSAGQEMVELHPWQGLRKTFAFTTQPGDTGSYELPDDFSYMLDQTGWNKTDRLPVGGPLTAQAWSYIDGIGLGDDPLYVVFQLEANKLQLLPQPPSPGIDIAFQYQSRNWVTAANGTSTNDRIDTGSDKVMLEPILMIKFLKVLFLGAKGFPTQDAKAELQAMFNSRTGKDTGADVLSASGNGYRVPLLGYGNMPWTGYGDV